MSLLRHLDYPPVWLAGFMVLAWFMAHVWAPFGDWLLWPGRVLIVVGIGAMIWAAVSFYRAQTTIVPHRAPSALVEDGPYRYSRNPIYLADLVILAGWALSLGAPAALLLLAPFYQVLQHRFVLLEEAALRARLGEEYAAFCSRTRRWI
ncbi:MAG: isoprenylcysteine carboxylmethyltransferase family protein [Pseudomonadota bacterium]